MNFKSLFIKEDLAATPKPQQAAQPTAVTRTPPAGVNVPPIKYTPPAPTIDNDIREALMQSFQENKLAGFDYLKFVATLEETKEIASDEGTRFKMVAMTAKQLGVDKTKLLGTAQHYLDVLESNKKEFAKDLAKQESTSIGTSTTRITALESQIESSKAKILKLQADIEAAVAEHSELTNKIAQERAQLDSTKAAFDTTADYVSSEINDNINKINKYL